MATSPERPAKRAVGRPSKYRPEFADQVYKICLLGATDEDIAKFFDVSEQTAKNWRAQHPDFLASIRAGRDEADAKVAERLYQRAMGYSHKAVKIFMPAGAGEPIYADYTEHYPPDTQAASLWLRNRQPERWRDKQVHEHGGIGGGPIQTEDVSMLSAVEREQRLLAVQQDLARLGPGDGKSVGPIVGLNGNGHVKH